MTRKLNPARIPEAPKTNQSILTHPIDSLSHCGLVRRLPVHLIAGRVEDDGHGPHRLELGVGLVDGVAEVFDLGHRELADAQQAGAGRDLVSEQTSVVHFHA